jgi:uncharacterized protein involved in cysteine biosynthesis
MLAGLVNAPFYDLLSEKVEALALGRRARRPWSLLLTAPSRWPPHSLPGGRPS